MGVLIAVDPVDEFPGAGQLLAILCCPFTDHCTVVAALYCLVPVAHALTVRVTFLGCREEFASCTSRS